WRHNEAGLVADAAGGVLVHFHAGDTREVDGIARTQHALRETADFAVGHPREVDRHQERRHLIVGNVSAGVTFHQKLNLFGREFFSAALPLDQVNCTHYETLSVPSEHPQSKGRVSSEGTPPPARIVFNVPHTA